MCVTVSFTANLMSLLATCSLSLCHSAATRSFGPLRRLVGPHPLGLQQEIVTAINRHVVLTNNVEDLIVDVVNLALMLECVSVVVCTNS